MLTPSSREQIASLLAAADEDVRLKGVRTLAAAADEALLDLVFQGFGDASWRVRKEAADLFLALPVSRQLIGEIVELLYAEENAGLRNTAVDILVRIGRDAVPMLIDQACSSDHDVRKFIVDILGEIADPRAVPVLLAALEDDDGNVRAAAAENLGKLGAGGAVPALLDAMRHPDVLLRFTILEALGKIGVPVPLARLQPFRDEKLLRKALIDCLGKVGDATAISELLAGLSDPMRNVRDASLLAIMTLAERSPREVADYLAGRDFAATAGVVLDYLGDEQLPPLRKAAVSLLGWFGWPGAVPPLLDRLADESLQREILAALVSIGRQQPQAVATAWDTATNLQRAYLAYVASEAECAALLPRLCSALASDDPRLTQMAAHALGRLGGEREVPALVACLRHVDGDVREAAAQSLASLGDRFPQPVLAALVPLLDDADPARRGAAVGVLGRLRSEDVAQPLAMALKDPAAFVRRAALKALAGTGVDEHLLAVQLSLTDEDAEVRRAAAEILGASGSTEAVDGLRLALQDEDIWVRAGAVRSLGRVGGTAEADAVGRLLGDPVGLVSIAALETLVDLLGEQACPQLLTTLDHPDEEVVSVALDLLSRCAAGSWLTANAATLASHPARQVRAHSVRLLADRLGAAAGPVLEQRRVVEDDAIIRQQLDDALDGLSAS